jgi:hypothetical protein
MGASRHFSDLAVKVALLSLGPPLMANSLFPGQEKRTMHRPKDDVGNSG